MSDPPISADAPSSAYVLEINQVTTVGGGSVTALRDVSLGLSRGSVTALFGAPGSGPRTVLACAAGRVLPSSGTVTRPGTVVEGGSATERPPAPDDQPSQPPPPPLVLADEPTPHAFDRLRDAVRATGGTLLIATSDPEVASGADVVVLMVGGRVVDAMAGASASALAAQLDQLADL